MVFLQVIWLQNPDVISEMEHSVLRLTVLCTAIASPVGWGRRIKRDAWTLRLCCTAR